jgi:hypothetical protein
MFFKIIKLFPNIPPQKIPLVWSPNVVVILKNNNNNNFFLF